MTRRLDTRPRLIEGASHGDPDEEAIASLLAKLPSALPHDVAVERVWGRLKAAPAKTSTFGRLTWVPALAFVALFFAILMPARTLPAELTLSSGGVFSEKQREAWRASQPGESLVEAEALRTDTTGHAMLRVRGVAAVAVRESTDLAVLRLRHGTTLRLLQGALTARVSKRGPDEPFVVETPSYTVTVVGTLFTVEEGPGAHTAVSVREGTVVVADHAGHVDRVNAGERWVSESRDVRTADHTPDALKALLEEGLAGKASAALRTPFAAALGSSVHATLAPPPSEVSVPTPVPTPAPPAVPSSIIKERAPVPAVGFTEVTPPDTHGDPVVASAEPAPSPAPSASAALDEGPYARGLALEARGDFEGAARELGHAADQDAAHADIALYALGRLAQRRLHDARRARTAFDAYRARYPQGPLLPEVDLAILEIEVDGHSQAEALADSARFLAVHPGSERAGEVHLLRGNLLRDADPMPRSAPGVRERHVCPVERLRPLLHRLLPAKARGPASRAAATLRAYLSRFPGGAHRVEAERALSEE